MTLRLPTCTSNPNSQIRMLLTTPTRQPRQSITPRATARYRDVGSHRKPSAPNTSDDQRPSPSPPPTSSIPLKQPHLPDGRNLPTLTVPYYSHGEPRDRSCPPPAVSYRRVTRPAIRVLALAVFAGLFLGLSPGFAQTPDCSNGVAVPDPTNNPGLAADCETLLAARDTLAGTATLNWSDSTSIDSWTGLTSDLTWTKAGGADSDAFTLNKSGDLASVSAKDKDYEELFLSFASGTQTSNTFDGTELDVDGTRFAQGATRTVETDRAALVALYNSTNGTSWTYSTNWNTTAELSTWYGVRTDADGLVRYLGLNYNQLSGSIDQKLLQLARSFHTLLDERNHIVHAHPATCSGQGGTGPTSQRLYRWDGGEGRTGETSWVTTARLDGFADQALALGHQIQAAWATGSR